MHDELPNHSATPAIEPELDAFRHVHELNGNAELIAATERVEAARKGLDHIESTVATGRQGAVDAAVAEYVVAAQDSKGALFAAEVGIQEVDKEEKSQLTAWELGEVDVDNLGTALKDLGAVEGPDSVDKVIERIEAAETRGTAVDDREPGVLETPTPKMLADMTRERYRLEHTAAQWRKDVFGESDSEPLVNDFEMRMQIPNSQRHGETLIDPETGHERKPIMDISMEIEAKQLVAETVMKRSKELALAVEELRGLQTGNIDDRDKTSKCSEILSRYRKNGAWEEVFLSGIANEQNGPGSVADLYIDQDDLVLYDLADEMARSMGVNQDSRAQIYGRLMSLAVSTFPAGTELLHTTTDKGLEAIRRHGSISPRNEFLNGLGSNNTAVNGAYVHLTGPSSAAYEYGDLAPTVIGLSIEEIMKNSPILHLEPSYIGNQFRSSQEEKDITGASSYVKSIQQPMIKFTINHPLSDDIPQAFKKRLATMHEEISQGTPQVALIGQGALNNYSFAASDIASSAGRYNYPIENARVIMERGKVRKAQKNFELSDSPLVVYGPGATERVSFTENTIDTTYRPAASLENTVPEALPNFIGEIIKNNPAQQEEVMNQTVQAINSEAQYSTAAEAAFRSLRNAKVSEDIVIALVKRLPIEKIALSFTLENGPSETKRVVVDRILAEKDSLPPDWIEWPIVRESGYVPSVVERHILDTQISERQRENETDVSKPSISNLSF